MENDKMIAAWNRMNPDSSTKEKILQQILETAETSKKSGFIRKFRRFAVGFAAAVVLLLGSFGTAYAASPVFKDFIHSLLFPLYTSDEIVSIDNGHMTGSFDTIDVLLSFLDRFNKEEFENSVTAARENGYRYSLFVQDENELLAFVDSNIEGYCIVVYMARIAYESTEGIWQVTGYQILEASTAEVMKNQLEPYSDQSADEIISVPQEDTAIMGQEDSVIMYNVNEKTNVVSVNEDDGRIVSDILDACDRSENIAGGLFQYVVKINDTSYMFDSNGNGVVNTAESRWGITIKENDLEVIMALFEQYHISLEELLSACANKYPVSDEKLLDHTLSNQIDHSTANDSLPESGMYAVETEPQLNDCSVTIGNVTLSLSESRQDIVAKLEEADFDYSESKPDYPDEAKYDFFTIPQDVCKFIFWRITVSESD